jgi:hypothetical protein
LIGPQHRTVDVVEKSVAVRADQGHFARGLKQLVLELRAFLARLDKAGGITDRTTCAPSREISDDVDCEVAIHSDIGGIGAPREVCYGPVNLSPLHLLFLGVNGPDFALVAQSIALADEFLGHSTAEDRDGFRPQ